MKLISLVTIALMFEIIFLGLGIIPAIANDDGVSNDSTACFTYNVGAYSSYYWIANLTDDRMGLETGSVAIYDNGSHIFLWIGVWSKPYLAYGELDKDGDGLMDVDAKDKNGDGVIDRYDLKSNGIIITGLGNPYGIGKDEEGYRWKVDSNQDGSPKNRRDPEITVPSWDLNLNAGGILDGPIVYAAKIPIPEDKLSFDICIKMHASPPALPPFPIFVISEFPLGLSGVAVLLFSALSIFALSKKKF